MKQNLKILNNSYNNIEYAMERTIKSSTISVDTDACGLYEDATTDDISGAIMKRKLYEIMLEEFNNSRWVEKYGNGNVKKIDKNDISDIFHEFNELLTKKYEYDVVDVFCVIAEFFDLNYTTLYRDIITISHKMELIKALKERYGLSAELGTRKNRLY